MALKCGQEPVYGPCASTVLKSGEKSTTTTKGFVIKTDITVRYTYEYTARATKQRYYLVKSRDLAEGVNSHDLPAGSANINSAI